MRTAILSRVFLLGLVAWALSGCGSNVDFVRVDPTEFPSRDSKAPVEIHRGKVLRPHIVIGVVTASQNMEATTGALSTYDDVVRQLKEKARKVGGDALVELRPVYSDGASLNSEVQFTAKVVKFLEK